MLNTFPGVMYIGLYQYNITVSLQTHHISRQRVAQWILVLHIEYTLVE